MNTMLLLIAFITLIINVPFGFWRQGLQKFSVNWYIAVHAAVPIVIAMRILAGIEWRIATIGFLVLSYFLGQLIGSKLRKKFKPAP